MTHLCSPPVPRLFRTIEIISRDCFLLGFWWGFGEELFPHCSNRFGFTINDILSRRSSHALTTQKESSCQASSVITMRCWNESNQSRSVSRHRATNQNRAAGRRCDQLRTNKGSETNLVSPLGEENISLMRFSGALAFMIFMIFDSKFISVHKSISQDFT